MYQSFVGLEIHIQLLTKTKAFCGCKAAFGDKPNTNICPVCMGYPGVLPALNEEAIRMAYLVARTLDCELAIKTYFDRKNYFYPDMPKNYQISQFRSPVGVNGRLDFEFRKRKKQIRIKDVHLEEDAGKMIHAGDMSLLDYNRAGTPLLEIVTQPDLETGEEAEAFLLSFRRLVRYLGVCDGNMEEGSLRCDVNVSVNLADKGLGTKVEIKNLNSSRFVKKALGFEIDRQTEILEKAGAIRQETRLWNENRDVTEVMRVKESESDYRYFPEPDLPPFNAGEAFLASVEERLVELPQARRERLLSSYGLPEVQADIICEEKETADFYEKTIALGADPQAACLWLTSDVRKHLNRSGLRESESPLTSERFAELMSLIARKRIHGKIAKQVLEAVFNEDKSPGVIVSEKGWEQLTTREELLSYVKKAVEENPASANQVREGDKKPLAFLMGKIMSLTGGRAEPQITSRLLADELSVKELLVLAMGGAITAKRTEDGVVVPGDESTVARLVRGAASEDRSLRIETATVAAALSEEITPSDWAALAARIALTFDKQPPGGIVITHGTDTLAYTASLVYWLFPSPPCPIVFAYSPVTPTNDTDEARVRKIMEEALARAAALDPGVYVACGDALLSPINLRFMGKDPVSFKNLNMEEPLYRGIPLKASLSELADADALALKFEAAAKTVCVLKVFPGMQGEILHTLMAAGITRFILELYGGGTANAGRSIHSIRKALIEGREKQVAFYCTSQQEGSVDFSEYESSHVLWQEGAIPMGSLTTESAYSRLIAAIAVSESDEEAAKLMVYQG